MSTSIDNEKINMKMAQIQIALRDNLITHQNDTKWLLEKINNINYQVVATNYLESKYANWIGNTALHFAVDESKSEAFEILLNHGADFTLRNGRGLTALHLIMQKLKNSTSAYKLDNTFVNSVLSAHLQSNNFNNPLSDYGLSHFHVACAANNVEVVKGFLQSGVFIDHAVKIDSPFFPGYTSLHFAAKYCAFEVAQLLLSHGVNLHIKDAKGMTALHLALEKKLEMINDADSNETLRDTNDKMLLLLLSKSNDGAISTDDWGLSDFHVSCALRDVKIAECLFLHKVVNIDHTVNVDSPLWPGYSALHFAALCNLSTVKILMKNGADINVKDVKGVTPLDMCIERYKIEDVHEIICLNPVWRNIMLSDGKTKLLDLVFAMKDSNQLDIFLSKFISMNISICKDSALWPGYSPMHLAVMFAKKDAKANEESEQMNLNIIRILCKQNSRMLFSQDVHGRTPLHLAFLSNKKSALDLLMKLLKERPNLEDRVDEDGLSFVHIASAENDDRTLGRLLSMGTNVNIVYTGMPQCSPIIYSNSTPLHFAVSNGSNAAVDILMKFGANLYVKDANDMTPIHSALLNEKIVAAEKLIKLQNLKESTVSNIGLSHLHVACWCNVRAAVYRLLENGADINAQITCQENVESSIISSLLEQYAGYSPLIFAFRDVHFDTADTVVDLLLERGADIFVEYEKGLALFYYILNNCECYMDEFLKIVKNNETLMARVNAETGMTSLHIACFDLDIELIEKSLNDGTNVNARISTDSPIFQGYTPLHILMHVSERSDEDDKRKVIELLVDAGANVTLQNAKFETPVYMAYRCYDYIFENKESYTNLNMLLEAQRDFQKNPTTVEGFSHFHIACCVCNIGIIKEFLNSGKIDINQRIDYFSDEAAGYSALQLVTESKANLCGVSRQLEAVDLLLGRGADVYSEDYYGNNPFHECARYNSIDLFERLARSGGDANNRDIRGETPLNYYLSRSEISMEEIKAFARYRCCLNTYSAVAYRGILGNLLTKVTYTDLQMLFPILTINFKDELQTDKLGRTVIHNIVSTESSPEITANQYAQLIEQLSRTGCDIDDQDIYGRTALHVAVKFYNFKGISGLLIAGADVNIADINGKTVFACCDFVSCAKCENQNDIDKRKCEHFETLKVLAIYVKKLQLCGLDVNKQNEDLTSKAFETLQSETALTDEFFKELETVKSIKIRSHALTLDDFLSEFRAIVNYPRMSEAKRKDVNKFFSPDGAQILREQFPELAGFFQLQFRKTMARSNLLELSKDALAVLIGFRLPEICSEFILILLKNSELKNLIASMSSIENAK